MRLKTTLKINTLMAWIALMNLGVIQANPSGGVVTHGSATISNSPGYTHINQTSDKAIINWQSFNINQTEHTHFTQPNINSTVLNRINPASGISQILGRLSATGQVFLINPAGIFFGHSAIVDVGGLVATTADITDTNFLNENYIFQQNSAFPNSSIINFGSISAKDSGLVALVAPGVANFGSIIANTGKVVLSSGTHYTLDTYGDDLIHFALDGKTNQTPTDNNGNTMNSAINNTGQIYADGGKIILKANVAEDIVDNVINMTGVAKANSISQVGGKIILSANTGKVKVKNATIKAKGNNNNKGGSINVQAKNIDIENSTIDVSGDTGGGLIQIGIDDFNSDNPILAKTTYIDNNSNIKANANLNGDGGDIYIWSDEYTTAYANFEARGGLLGGHGGFVETSANHTIDFSQINVNTLAPMGNTGTWLIDPIDIFGGAGFDSSVISTQLASNNVSISAAGLAFTGAHVMWGSNHTFEVISTVGDITIDSASSITNTGTSMGTFIVNSANTIFPSGPINVYKFILAGGTWNQSVDENASLTSLPTFNANDFSISGGTFMRFNGGMGTTLDPYQLTDIFGLQGIGSPSNNLLDQHYKLINDIDASGTANWNTFFDEGLGETVTRGFAPIGRSLNPFTGTLNGASNANNNFIISDLFINRAYEDFRNADGNYIGLFGNINGSDIVGHSISNLRLESFNIKGNLHAGGLSGWLQNASVANIIVNGVVSTNRSDTGGLIGRIVNSIVTNSNANVNVEGTAHVGGLVGKSDNSVISNSYAMGNIVGGIRLGGLVGDVTSESSILNSYATGNVTGKFLIGGLVGFARGSDIFYSYATGDIFEVPGNTSGSAGGLIGYLQGRQGSRLISYIENSFATGNVYSNSNFVGGFGGTLLRTQLSNNFAIGNVFGADRVGGFVGLNERSPMINNYSIGKVFGSGQFVGGFVGLLSGVNPADLPTNFWNIETSGTNIGIVPRGTYPTPSVTSKTIPEMMMQTTFSNNGWDFSNGGIWEIKEGHAFPVHQWSNAQPIAGRVFTDPQGTNLASSDTQITINKNDTTVDNLTPYHTTGFFYSILMNKNKTAPNEILEITAVIPDFGNINGVAFVKPDNNGLGNINLIPGNANLFALNNPFNHSSLVSQAPFSDFITNPIGSTEVIIDNGLHLVSSPPTVFQFDATGQISSTGGNFTFNGPVAIVPGAAGTLVQTDPSNTNFNIFGGFTNISSGPLNVIGNNANDNLTIDFQNIPLTLNGVNFNGGGSNDSDLLVIRNLFANTVKHTGFDKSSGNIDIDGRIINYTNLEPILDYLIVSNRIFEFTSPLAGTPTIQQSNIDPILISILTNDSEDIHFLGNFNTFTIIGQENPIISEDIIEIAPNILQAFKSEEKSNDISTDSGKNHAEKRVCQFKSDGIIDPENVDDPQSYCELKLDLEE